MTRRLAQGAITLVVALAALFGWRMVHDARALGSVHAGATQVSVHGMAFSPRVISVPAGTTVTWHFTDDTPHDVTGPDFKSAVLSHADFAHTFTAPGTYDYHCSLHPIMRGRIVVTAP